MITLSEFIFVGITIFILLLFTVGFFEFLLMLFFSEWYFKFGPKVYQNRKLVNNNDDPMAYIKSDILPGWIVKESKIKNCYLSRKSFWSFVRPAHRAVLKTNIANSELTIEVRLAISAYLFSAFAVILGFALIISSLNEKTGFSIIFDIIFSVIFALLFMIPVYWINKSVKNEISEVFKIK